LQYSWAIRHHERMNAYSEDLRKKVVEAVEARGMPKIEAARALGVDISSVKRYVATYREGRSLAPKKRPGSKPKLDKGARRSYWNWKWTSKSALRPRCPRGASCWGELAG
jgi:transposase